MEELQLITDLKNNLAYVFSCLQNTSYVISAEEEAETREIVNKANEYILSKMIDFDLEEIGK